MKVLASPASLKGVLSAVDAADALAEGLRRGGADADALPVADGGDGTLDVLERVLGGERRSARVTGPLGGEVDADWLVLDDGTAVVESARALGLHTVDRLDPLRASSRGLGELILATRAEKLIITLGGTVTVDGGAGMREVLRELPAGTVVLSDVQSPLRDAAYVFATQKGATPDQLEPLAQRLRGLPDVPGSGAAGGLGAALYELGGELVPGASKILDLIGFDALPYQLVVTGEGKVDATTFEGKAPGEVKRRCSLTGTRCVIFSAADELPGGPESARADLVAYGERLARAG